MHPNFNHPNRRQLLAGLASLAAAGTAGNVLAQAAKYPTKPVTLVVPYSAGGGTDIVGRLMAQRLTELWGQSMVVENRTGANGVIGSSTVARAAPDGHTLMLVVGSHAINPVLMKSLPYDTDKAFTAVTNIASSPSVLVVQAGGPYKTLPDLLAAARKEELGCGYSEGLTRLTGELIRQAGNLKLTGVPYKGGAPIMVDIIGGHLPMGVTSVLTALPHVRSGALRVVGVASDRRMPLFPDAMTFKEAGLDGVESLSWYGLFGPAGLPEPIVAQLNQDLKKVTSDAVVQKQMHDQGADITLTPPAEFRSFLASETRKWAQVAQRGGIKAE
ncbi:tripartite tricarboxylate transporter substrate binding protein [Acidovorax sp. CCYZU-2555]|uniref:tripartite tricarboxylate transporter substrate binding protein n=1 Tax=Acidovorax sp. CCYZU-2555 TaxID=2835042 RepID=UPI001BCAFCE2|nr:tripartite tricarboxylate transporter substrate binding protein [Acidovorax sp. CCYZU-2555]MBS7780002.1 tripartite tricarboxylate transporter substrate binding protein [Acidovorax sp. CCYZU-2555]